MMEALGPKNVLTYAKRFGFEENFPPYLAIALGAGDATLLEVTSAYSVFPNQGVRMKPFSILSVMDRGGNLLEENRAEPTDVIRADTAFVDHEHAARRRPARNGSGRGEGRLAARREDRHRRRQHRRVVHRVRSGHHCRRLDGAR